MQYIVSDVHVWYTLDHFLFRLVTYTNNCMYNVTTVHIDYSGNLHYMQGGSNKYTLIRVIVYTYCTQQANNI